MPSRRELLLGTVGASAWLTIGCAPAPCPVAEPKAARPAGPPPPAPLTEGLLEEHGLLHRVLVVYDESARRLEASVDIRPDVVPAAAHLIRTFDEDFHQGLEEAHVFPRFEQALSHVDLVRTLRDQHQSGRKVTAAIEQLAGRGARTRDERRRLATLLRAFTRMMRPHEARESSVLLPDLRELLSADDLVRLGDVFARRERELFGENGFEQKLGEVDQLEMALELHDLGQFTVDSQTIGGSPAAPSDRK